MDGPWNDFKGSAAKTPPAPGPWDDFAQADQTPAPKLNASAKRAEKSKLESAAAGVTQGATFGYTPQIVGGLAKLGGKVEDLIRGPVINPKTGQPIERDPYIQSRDAMAADLTKARDDNPGSYMAGNLAGALAVPLPGGAAKTVGQAATRGALYGFGSNPGETKGEISPFQPAERAVNAAVGAGFGAVGKGLSNTIGQAARGSRAADELVNSEIGPKLQNEVRSATNQLQTNYLNPLKQEAKAGMQGKTVTFNPNILEHADEPGLMQALQKRTPGAQKQLKEASMMGTGVKVPAEPGDNLVTLDLPVANRLRQRLYSKSEIKQKSAVASPTVAKNARETFAAGNSLKDLRDQAAPELVDNFKKQSYGYGLKNDINNRANTNPITALTPAPGDINQTKLSAIDARGGTDLAGRGADLRRGQYLLGKNESNLNAATTEGIWHALGRKGISAGSYGARLPDNINRGIDYMTGGRGVSEAFIRDLVEQIARGK
jgi:hypothetical protein